MRCFGLGPEKCLRWNKRKRNEWLPENKFWLSGVSLAPSEPTPTQLAPLPPASPLIERVYYAAGCWWAPYGPAPVLPVLASKPSPQAQGLASGEGSHGRVFPVCAPASPSSLLRPSLGLNARSEQRAPGAGLKAREQARRAKI